jgi:hypothetical protein
MRIQIRNKNQETRLTALKVELFTNDFSLQYSPGMIYERVKQHERKANKARNTQEINL